MQITEIIHIRGNNFEFFKYKNARVKVTSVPNSEYVLEFKILDKNVKNRADMIRVTGFRVSKEAAMSLVIGLSILIKKDL